MKIYVVSHYYDNGESYEDYRDYETHFHFSTLEKANSFFWEKAVSDYGGKWVMVEKTLDTQEEKELETTPYLECHSFWDDYYAQCNSDYVPEVDPLEEWADEHYWNGQPKHPEKDIQTAWEYLNWLDTSEEDQDVAEYLNSNRANFKLWDEVNAEIFERKKQIQFEALLDDLNSLLDV